MREAKQVIVARRDLKMPEGKLASQVAHASLKVILNEMTEYKSRIHDEFVSWDLEMYVGEPLHKWVTEKFTKIVLGVDSEEELLLLARLAAEAGLRTALIEDEGRTVFDGVKTFTCLAIGPNWPDEINKITGHLKLY